MRVTNIIKQLREAHPSLSPRMRSLATYIVEHHKEAAFMNAAALAKAAGVSEATVTRLAYALDLNGYPGLRAALQSHAKGYMALPKYVPAGGSDFLLAKVAGMEKSIIDEMLLSINPELFERTVDSLFQARKVTMLGLHFNVMPASYGAYFLSALRPSVRLVKDVDVAAFTGAQESDRRDVVLAICTARYPRGVLKLLPLFKERGATVIAVTDSPMAPVAPLADICLIVPMKFLSYVDPFAGIMVLLHALVNGVYLKDPDRARRWLKKYDAFMDCHEYNSVEGLELGDLL